MRPLAHPRQPGLLIRIALSRRRGAMGEERREQRGGEGETVAAHVGIPPLAGRPENTKPVPRQGGHSREPRAWLSRAEAFEESR